MFVWREQRRRRGESAPSQVSSNLEDLLVAGLKLGAWVSALTDPASDSSFLDNILSLSIVHTLFAKHRSLLFIIYFLITSHFLILQNDGH